MNCTQVKGSWLKLWFPGYTCSYLEMDQEDASGAAVEVELTKDTM